MQQHTLENISVAARAGSRVAKGDGTMTGARMQPQAGVGAEIYNDVVLNIKK
jgi:hypothetical protein